MFVVHCTLSECALSLLNEVPREFVSNHFELTLEQVKPNMFFPQGDQIIITSPKPVICSLGSLLHLYSGLIAFG